MKVAVLRKTPIKAELLVKESDCGAMQISVDVNDRIISVKTPGAGNRIVCIAHAPLAADIVIDFIYDIEDVVEHLFPDFKDCDLDWVWFLNEDCNTCKCHNCLN